MEESRASARASARRTLIPAGLPVDDDGNDAGLAGFEAGDQKSMIETVHEARRKTLMDPAQLELIEQENPGLAAWLRSSSGFILQILLFCLFIGIDAGKSLFLSKALDGSIVISTSIVMMSSLSSIIIGLVLAGGLDGVAGIRLATDLSTVKKFSLPACMFALSQCFNTLSYTVLSAGMIKIFGQFRLLQTALLSTFFLGRRYIGPQWAVMIVVVMSALIFMQGKLEHDEAYNQGVAIANYTTERTLCATALMKNIVDDTTSLECPEGKLPSFCTNSTITDPTAAEASTMTKGLIYVFLYLFLSDVGSIFSEKFLKDDTSVPFYVQKVAIELSGFPVAIIMSVAMPFFQQMIGVSAKRYEKAMWWSDGRWLFQGWTDGTGALLALFFNCAGSWLSGIIVKRMSSVMKLFGKVLSMGVVYFIGDCWLLKVDGRSPPMICTLANFIIMSSLYTFGNIKAPPPEKKKEAPLPSVQAPARSSRVSNTANIEMNPSGGSGSAGGGGGFRV